MSNPAWVSGNSFITGVGSTLTVKNVSGSVSAGNVITMVVASFWDQGIPGIPTITDNQHNGFTWLAGKSNTSIDGCRVDIFASPPLGAGAAANGYIATVVAAQNAGFNEIGSSIQEWSGFGLYGPSVDVTGGAALGVGSSSGSVTLSSGTSVQPVEAIIAGLHFFDDSNPDGVGTPTGTGTWVLDIANLNAAATLAVGYAHQVTSATGTAYTATWSGLDTSTAQGGSMVIAALYPTPPPASGWAVGNGPGLSPVKQMMFAPRALSYFLAPNVTVSLTGQVTTSTPGAVAQALDVPTAGQAIASAIGSATLALSPPVVGLVLASTTGAVAPSSTIGATGQGATFAPGTIPTPGLADVTVTLNGQTATVNAGYVTANGDILVYLTGQSIGSTAGAMPAQNLPTVLSQVLVSSSGAFGISMVASIAGQNSTTTTGTLGQGTTVAPAGQQMPATLGSLAGPSNVVTLNGQPLRGVQGVFGIPGFGGGITWDSSFVTWDSSIVTWDGGTSASVQAKVGQVNPTGPGISPDYNRLFSRTWGDTTSIATVVTASLAGIPLVSTAGSIFAQVNNTLTLNLAGQRIVSAPGSVLARSDVTVALTGLPLQTITGQIKYAPIIPVDQEYVVSIPYRAFTVSIDAISSYTVSIAPRSFTVSGS